MEIRRSYDRLISTMGFPILVRRYLCIESGSWYCVLQERIAGSTCECDGRIFIHYGVIKRTHLPRYWPFVYSKTFESAKTHHEFYSISSTKIPLQVAKDCNLQRIKNGVWRFVPKICRIPDSWSKAWHHATNHYLNEWCLVYWRIYVSLGLYD